MLLALYLGAHAIAFVAGLSIVLPAVLAAGDLRAKRSLGIHYGTFDLSDESTDEPPRRFRAAMVRNGFADDAIWIFDVGGSREF